MLEWQLALLMILGGLLFMLATGMPVAFSFMLVNVIGVFLFWSGEAGLRQLTLSMVESVASFALLPVPLFILMGELIFQSGLAPSMMDAVDKWLGRLPGRLGLLSVSMGVMLSTTSGSSMASTAVLGSLLVPEVQRRGYKKAMSLGPILGSGGLAMMIPPSTLAVLLGAIGQISIGKLLIAIIVPGLTMATLYAAYIIIRCKFQPSIAPPYDVPHVSIREKFVAVVQYILPLGFVIFMVVGVIFLGIATPSEAAVTGTLSCFILAACYRKLNWGVVKKSFLSTIRISAMMLMIITGAVAFSQVLAFSGVSEGLIRFIAGFPLAPLLIVISMQVMVLIMGMFMEPASIMMISLPIFMPIIRTLGFDPVWFGVLLMVNIEMAVTTPPFGMCLFVMKGVAPPDTGMGDIYRAGLPFLGCDLVVMALILAFPILALWLPGLMR